MSYRWINFGYSGTYRQEPLMSQTLDYLVNYFDGFRVVIPHYSVETSNISLRNELRHVCEEIMNRGKPVIWGYTANGGSPLTSTTINTFKTNTLSIATWVASLPHPELFILSLANEDDHRVDGTTLTTSQFQTHMRGMPPQVAAISDKIRTIISFTTADASTWRNNLGPIHFGGLNVYSGRHNFHSQILSLKQALGSRGMITEWSADDFGAVDFPDDESFARELFSRDQKMTEYRQPHCLFSFDASSGIPQQWGFRLTDGTTRPSFDVFIQPKKYVDTWKYPTIPGE